MNHVVDDSLRAGRDALRRHAWREAFEHLTAADASLGLSPQDVEGLAEAAWWTGQLAECISARERAYAMYLESANHRRAAAVALELVLATGSAG